QFALDGRCPTCGEVETDRHFVWDYPVKQTDWRTVARRFSGTTLFAFIRALQDQSHKQITSLRHSRRLLRNGNGMHLPRDMASALALRF
ncbi:hypothetical protein BJV82DRAFT_525796, partial [Fennellomyces sp. T-0311]